MALARDVLQLETAVVTGTATSVSRLNAANAVATVSAEQLVGRAPAQSIDNALQGKVAGAIISTNSGAPGGGSQMQLRGVSSINASSTPLYVVDGVLVSNQSFGNGLNSLTSATSGQGASTISTTQDQMANRIADLNPEDIESVEILKGPSAGAIYGSKAANGVVVIRTKRGQAGRPTFNVAQRVGMYQLQSERKLDVRCFGSVEEAMDWEGVDDASELATPFTGECHDFQDAFYRASGPSYQTALSLRGGSAGGTSYHVSGLLQRDNAIQKGTYYGKQSLSANVYHTFGAAPDVGNPLAVGTVFLNPTIAARLPGSGLFTNRQGLQAGDQRQAKIAFLTADVSRNGVSTTFGTTLANTAATTQTRPLAILRNAELVLLRAQAYLELGRLAEATATVNAVRTVDGGLAALPTFTSREQGVQAVLYEKRFSLLLEGAHRLVDLRAYNLINPTYLGPSQRGTADAFQVALPIPQQERDARGGTVACQ